MKKTDVRIIVNATPRGIDTITVRVPQGRRSEGLEFLGRVLPDLQTLSQRIGQDQEGKRG